MSSANSSLVTPLSSARLRWNGSSLLRYNATSVATVMRLRSRGERPGRFHTFPNSTLSVYSARAGAMSAKGLRAGAGLSVMMISPVLCGPSAADSLLQFLRIARALHRDLGCGAVDLAKIRGAEFDGRGADVLFQPGQLCGAGDGSYPGLLCQEPGQGDLRRCGLLAFRHRRQQIH